MRKRMAEYISELCEMWVERVRQSLRNREGDSE